MEESKLKELMFLNETVKSISTVIVMKDSAITEQRDKLLGIIFNKMEVLINGNS